MNKHKRTSYLFRMLVSLFVLAALIFSITQSSFSWISRKWSANVQQERIRIEANNSIAFKLDENDDDAKNAADLVELIGGISSFVLKPVSNCTGESSDFFKLDRTYKNEQFLHISVAGESDSLWTEAGINNGYIETKIYIIGTGLPVEDSVKYVFINPKSHIFNADTSNTNDAASAIRVSITYSSLGEKNTVIFSRDGQGRVTKNNETLEESSYSYKAISNEYDVLTKQYIMHGASYFADEGRSLRTSYVNFNNTDYSLTKDITSSICQFSDYYGYIMDEEGNKYVKDNSYYVDADFCLFELQPDTTNAVTIRVWLEGEDENCTEDIAGMDIDFLLSFDAVTCSNKREAIGDLNNCYRVINVEEAATATASPSPATE